MPPEETLDALFQAEVDVRRQRAFAYRLRTSRLRTSPAFEDFDLSVRRSLSKTTLREIASLSCLRDGRPLVLIGQTGVGKSFLAQAAGHRACQEGKTVLFLSVTHWLEQLQEARISHTFLRFRDRICLKGRMKASQICLLTPGRNHTDWIDQNLHPLRVL